MYFKRRYLCCLSAVFGMLLAFSSYIQAEKYLFKYFDYDINRYTGKDVLNVIFISDYIKRLEYLDEKNIMLFLPIISFSFIGLILGSSYLLVSDKYKCYLASRCRNSKILDSVIINKPVYVISAYVISFMICIYMKNGFNISGCILNSLSYIIMLDTIVSISYAVLKKYNSAVSVVSGFVIICLIYMIDTFSQNIHLILYSDINAQVYSVITFTILFFITKIVIKCLNRKEYFYVN